MPDVSSENIDGGTGSRVNCKSIAGERRNDDVAQLCQGSELDGRILEQFAQLQVDPVIRP